MSLTFDILLLLYLVAAALVVAQAKDLLAASIVFSSYGLALCLLWQYRGAPDVAMAEAAVGAGITTVLFLVAIGRTTRREK